ncbi:MAG: hypothetical protein NTY23_11560, partial [Chloroflexi bacterium]|nr:hypothetical protein [Chloroflexota bacterium]
EPEGTARLYLCRKCGEGFYLPLKDGLCKDCRTQRSKAQPSAAKAGTPQAAEIGQLGDSGGV